MSVVQRVRRTERLRRSWTAQHPAESPYGMLTQNGITETFPAMETLGIPMVDDSLTSLSWLQNLNIMKIDTSCPTTNNISVASCSTNRSISLPATSSNYSTFLGGPLEAPGTTYQRNNVPPPLNVTLEQNISRSNRQQRSYQQAQVPHNPAYEVYQAKARNFNGYDHYNNCYSYNQQQQMQKHSSRESYSKMQVNPNSILDVTSMGSARIKIEPSTSPLEPTNHYKLPKVKHGQMDQRLIDNNRSAINHKFNHNQRQHRIDPGVIEYQSGLDVQNLESVYGLDSSIKPHYSLATLICMALQDAPYQQLTCAEILRWIVDNFPYYRTAEPSWQNSVRHNLSLNKCFQKIKRKDDTHARSSLSQWTINPEYRHLVDCNVFKKRRQATGFTSNLASPPAKKSRGTSMDEMYLTSERSTSIEISPRNNSLPTLVQSSHVLDQPPVHISDSILNFGADSLTDALDMSWSANALDRDLDIGGMSFKAEDLIKDVGAFDSPPPSDTDSELALEEFLRTNVHLMDDEASLDPLDLTVQGVALRPPEWWAGGDSVFPYPPKAMSPIRIDVDLEGSNNGLHTPTFEAHDHPWAENKSDLSDSISSLDTDLLENDFKPFL